jgi:uncharacterized protein (TIGR00299 family) protein
VSSDGGRTSLLYVDCVGGVAGDMLLGALLDAGVPRAVLDEGLAGLGVPGLALAVERTERHAVGATRVSATASGDQPHRTWADVRTLLDAAALPVRAAARAHDAFARLAAAEGRVHGVSPEDVHFHEVGAIDAIAEVCGVALALEHLGVERVSCSPLPMPRGFTSSAHGRLPLPAPAVLELLEGAPVYGVDLDVELVTPTGAALVAALAGDYGPLPPMRLAATGYGAGARGLEGLPNLVRVVLGEPPAAGEGGGAPVRLLEANLDDLLPELVPDAAAAAFAAGALDVWSTAVQMKQGRPGVVLSAIARPEREDAVATAMLRETGSLGLRVAELRRHELDRASRTVQVDGEPVRIKVGRLHGAETTRAPEHADCVRVAERTGRPVRAVWAAALAAAEDGADA